MKTSLPWLMPSSPKENPILVQVKEEMNIPLSREEGIIKMINETDMPIKEMKCLLSTFPKTMNSVRNGT